jgi:hypothetical protein
MKPIFKFNILVKVSNVFYIYILKYIIMKLNKDNHLDFLLNIDSIFHLLYFYYPLDSGIDCDNLLKVGIIDIF